MSTPENSSPENILDLMPLATTLGIRSVESERGSVRATLEHRPELCTTGDMLHGGAIMTLADSTGGACAFLNLPDGAAGTSTIESKTNFLRAVRSGTITAVSRPLHTGRTVIVVETDVTDADGRLVAKVTQTQAVLQQPARSSSA
ncbi:MAG TPA: PaaI family thioesterase [Acidimicrobiales bacterium]|nr:PaaI family thioesterase [Acidimicrobiales bacterium]